MLGVAIALYLAAIPFVYRFNALRAMNPDPFIYIQSARDMLAGKRLYSQTWQDKPPLAFVIYAIPEFLAPRSYLAQGFFLGVWIVAEGLMFFAAFRRDLPAACFCLIFTTLVPMMHSQWCWPSTEHFSNLTIALLLLLAYAIFRDRRFSMWQCAIIGATTVVTFNIRQNAVLAGVLPLAAVWLARESLRRKIEGIALMALAAAVCWGLVLLLLLRIGDLHGYFYTVFQYPHRFLGVYPFGSAIRLPRHIFFALSPLALVPLWLLARRSGHPWFIFSSLLVGVAVCILPNRPWTAYWVNLFPFLSLQCALLLRRQSIGSLSAQWIAVSALLLLGIANVGYQFIHVRQSMSTLFYQQVAARADQLAPPRSSMVVFGEMPCEAVTYFSHLAEANTFAFTFQYEWPYSVFLPKPLTTIFDEYLASPPGVIVVQQKLLQPPSDPSDRINSRKLLKLLFDAYSYHLGATLRDYSIYVRGDSSPMTTSSPSP
ncbi:MAG: hypothetical protein ABSF29_08165 [Tepidisphaeraceae bacterium]